MKRRIEKVAVLGAGTMGARIAAHLANAGFPCYLLDIVPGELTADEKARGLALDHPDVRNRIVRAGLEAAKKAKPAAFFTPDLPVQASEGEIAETFRQMPDVKRSSHPVLSFTALGEDAATILAAQMLDQPFGPIEWLRNHSGDVLLIGVDHTHNVSLHYAEHLASRKQFLRWALTKIGGRGTAIELPNFPGKAHGFNAIDPEVKPMTRQVQIGNAVVKRIPLELLIPIAVGLIDEDPKALL